MIYDDDMINDCFFCFVGYRMQYGLDIVLYKGNNGYFGILYNPIWHQSTFRSTKAPSHSHGEARPELWFDQSLSTHPHTKDRYTKNDP